MVNENISCSDLWIKIVLDELLPFDIAVVFLGVGRKVWKEKVETSVLIHRTAMWVDIVERNYIKLRATELMIFFHVNASFMGTTFSPLPVLYGILSTKRNW